jgi:hypothetical protein
MAEQLTVGSNETPEMTASEEAHNQEMIEKVEEVEHGIDGVNPVEQPEDKFGGDYEKLKKSYEELEKKFHSPNEVQEIKEESDLSIPEQSEAPFDMEALTQEYAESGGLTDASYKTLADAGISRDYADTYIAGVKALGEKIGNEVRSSVGGQEEYSSMVEWAKTNYTNQQIQVYDQAVNSGDVTTAMMAAKGLRADYQASVGKEGTTYGGQSPSSVTSDNAFRSNAEVVKAMRDPRYENDMAYRQDVLDKLDRSDIFSTGTI